jgi:hypothetical protein
VNFTIWLNFGGKRGAAVARSQECNILKPFEHYLMYYTPMGRSTRHGRIAELLSADGMLSDTFPLDAVWDPIDEEIIFCLGPCYPWSPMQYTIHDILNAETLHNPSSMNSTA